MKNNESNRNHENDRSNKNSRNNRKSRNNINNTNNTNNRSNGILFLFLLCMMLYACGKEKGTENAPSDAENLNAAVGEETVYSEDLDKKDIEQETTDKEHTDKGYFDEQAKSAETVESIENDSKTKRQIEAVPAEQFAISQRVNENGRELIAEELQFFDEFVQNGDNYGFLLSVYDTPADADLNEICYNGLGMAQSEITKEEEQAYLNAIGESELYTDFNRITTKQLDKFLLEKTGLSYAQMNTRLGWTYLSEYDAYYSQHGDTNYQIRECVKGYTADEKTFVLRTAAYDFGAEPNGYHEMEYELTLEKYGDTYQFKSNRMIVEEGLIENQTFQVELAPMGEVIFASYMPDTGKIPLADVSFSIIKDGCELTRLYGVCDDNVRERDIFDEIKAVSFADYDGDEITDVIMILGYLPISNADAAPYSEIRVYKGEYQEYGYHDYYYFQRYQAGLSETLSAGLPEKTISAVLDYLAGIEWEERKE